MKTTKRKTCTALLEDGGRFCVRTFISMMMSDASGALWEQSGEHRKPVSFSEELTRVCTFLPAPSAFVLGNATFLITRSNVLFHSLFIKAGQKDMHPKICCFLILEEQVNRFKSQTCDIVGKPTASLLCCQTCSDAFSCGHNLKMTTGMAGGCDTEWYRIPSILVKTTTL